VPEMAVRPDGRDILIFLANVGKYVHGRPLFEGVNLSIHRGDRVGIVGPNGAGKSTLLGVMEGIVSCDEGEVSVEKRIRMGVLHQELAVGNDMPILEEVMDVSEDLRKIRSRLSDLEARLENLSEDEEDSTDLLEEHGRLQTEFERCDGYTLESRAFKVLAGLGFSPRDALRPWREFSGGWRMRVSLAKILLAEPDVLLLDEPTNHLDLESLLWVENYLSNFKGALLLISHDRAFLNRLVKRIIEVDRGKATAYSGNYDTYERTKTMQEEVLVASYKNQQEKIKKIQAFINQNRVKARTASRVQSRVKMLEKMEVVEPPQRAKTLKFRFPQPSPSGRRVVEITGLVKTYGDTPVYSGLDLHIDRGERIGLVGPNGAGKSTLMKIMAGVLEHDEGAVRYGHNVSVGYFAQHQSEALNSELTVLDEASSTMSGLAEQDVRNLLGAFLFSGDDVGKKVKVLSGGEKSRLALTRILLNPPNFLLMDEPTNHLDIPSCEVLEEGLKKYEGTLVLITHDRRLMNEVCTGILEIQSGTAEYYLGNYDDYRDKKNGWPTDFSEQDEEPSRSLPETAVVEAPRESKKERKRREAQARLVLFRKQAPLREALEDLEKRISEKEQRKKEIEESLSDTSLYSRKEALRDILAEVPTLEAEIKSLESRWEEVQSSLEEIERSIADFN